jgi:hypothetical protein
MTQVTTSSLEARVNAQDERLGNHSDVDDQLWAAINALRNRLPLWATMLIAFLASTAGASLALLGDIMIRTLL